MDDVGVAVDAAVDAETSVEPPQTVRIRRCLSELATLYHDQFDRNWLYLILERSPLDTSVMGDVRDLVETDVAFLDPTKLDRHTQALEEYVQHLRRYVIPGLREKLGISGFTGGIRVLSEDQIILRKFIAYAFPHNLERLAALTSRLKELTGIYPAVRSA
jgi:hypothetical protein